jgi:predicted Fe-S protein YdhL (DUF1289 family)
MSLLKCNLHNRQPDRGSQVAVHGRMCFRWQDQIVRRVFRTLGEIRARKKMTDHRRHQVTNDRERRQAKLQRESSESPAEIGPSDR